MGVFDYVTCKYPLPVEGANDLEYQTKDFDMPYLERYEIREDGTLWHEEYDVEDRSDHNAEGLKQLLGMMTRVNQRWVQDKVTGEVRFYTYAGGLDLEFSAYFVRGALRELQDVSDPKTIEAPSVTPPTT